MAYCTQYYDSIRHEFVLHHYIAPDYIGYRERYPVLDILNISRPFENELGYVFRVSLKNRRNSPKINGRYWPRKFITEPLPKQQCHDLFNQIVSGRQEVLIRVN